LKNQKGVAKLQQKNPTNENSRVHILLYCDILNYMGKEEKSYGNQRFTSGKLVMLSKKNTRSGKLRCFSLEKEEEYSHQGWFSEPVNSCRNYLHIEKPNEFLERGEPVLLIEDPCVVSLGDERYFNCYNSRAKHPNFDTIWRIVFLDKEQVRVCYLTKKQYSQELVRAVIRRINKDYSLEKNKRI